MPILLLMIEVSSLDQSLVLKTEIFDDDYMIET